MRSITHNNCWMFERDQSRSVVEILTRATDTRFGHDTRGDYLRSNLLSKFSDPSPTSAKQRKLSAIAKLRAQELSNRETNLRLTHDRRSTNVGGHSIDALLWTAAKEIKRILGDLDPLEWFENCEFSSGASTTRKRRDAFKYKKTDSRSSASWRVRNLMRRIEKQFPDAPLGLLIQSYGLADDCLPCHDFNEIFTVPKNNEIDRCAAKEPDWNMFLQKGLGSVIRSRLKQEGIDLNDQSINASLAREGSVTGLLATLDLSAASDSITKKLVELLLPPDWYLALDCVRSRLGNFPDSEAHHSWELFSTMGNGFTFELESLIFYSLILAIKYHFGVKGKTSVYGDDIIVPVSAVLPLISVFTFCGFRVNPEKSFWTGSFRESCGGHYDRGIDITPIYIREPILDVPSLVNIINQFRRWSCIDGFGSDENFQLWKLLTTLIPKQLRHVIIGGNDTFQRSYVSAAIPFKGAIYEVSRTVPVVKTDAEACYASWMYAAESASSPEARHLTVETLRSTADIGPLLVGRRWYMPSVECRSRRESFQFGNFSMTSGKPAFKLKCLNVLGPLDDEELKLSLIRDDGWEYRWKSSSVNQVYHFFQEVKVVA